MVEEKGKKYFVSNWSECDCHLNPCMFDAMIELSKEFPVISIGVVDRDYNTGFIRVLCVYDNGINNDLINYINDRLTVIFNKTYKDSRGFSSRDYIGAKIYQHCDLNMYGYSERNIRYMFLGGSIFRKELA